MSRLPKFPREAEVLLINEFFHSIQGESTQAGRPCFFIRLTGCHLRCGYCDTEYAFHEGKQFTIDDVMARVRETGCSLVQLTGGEPLLQRPVYPLMERLLAEGYEVMLETSGSLDASRVPVGVRRIFDIKTPGSGEADSNRWDNFEPENLRERDEIKFVLCSRADYEWARDIVRNRLRVPPAHFRQGSSGSTTGAEGESKPGSRPGDRSVPILFSPMWAGIKPADLAEWIVADKLPVRFQLQLHKILWGEKRGV